MIKELLILKNYLNSEVLECRHKSRGNEGWYRVTAQLPAWNFSEYEFRFVPVKDYDEVMRDIEVMLAFYKKENIERMSRISVRVSQEHEWVEDSNPVWDFLTYDYRVKP